MFVVDTSACRVASVLLLYCAEYFVAREPLTFFFFLALVPVARCIVHVRRLQD